MEATHLGQRAWVENDLPRVSEVLEKFPPLKQPKHVSHSFYGITFYLWCRWLMINNFTKRLQHCLKNFSHAPYSFSLRYFLDDCISSSIASPVCDTEEVAREVWAGLQDKVQRVARRESGTRKGRRELLEKQTAELAVDDELGEDSLQIVY